ncbi:MAG: hypothetical protein QF886_14215 [Planctomycetota bacterium]|nr:hypothetical protein [Planctomycetota bacterium]
MLRFRNILILIAITGLVYFMLPAHRKQRFREKIWELRFALTVALVVYWILIVARKLYGNF